jgi:two-component system, LytTR family, sensor kinase
VLADVGPAQDSGHATMFFFDMQTLKTKPGPPSSVATTADPIRYPGFPTLLIACTLLGALAYTRHLLLNEQADGHVLRDLLGWLTCYYPWVLFTPVVFQLERRHPVGQPNSLPLLAVAAFPICYLAGELSALLGTIAEVAFHEPLSMPHPWWILPFSEYLFQLALYLVALGAAWITRNLIERQQSERRAAQLALEKSQIESDLRRAELDMLRMRLNPHFLFNSLQNISALTRQDPEAASQMLVRLGDVLRVALRKGAQAESTLSSEIELTKAYVAVEQIRFADRLSVSFALDPEVERALIPSFLLQPLVENAIQHGIRGRQSSGTIRVRGLRQSDQLILSVTDDGSGPPTERVADLEMGIGLGSTCERLERMYPGRHSLSMNRLQEGGTEIRIVLPLELNASAQESRSHEPSSINHR